MQRNRLRWIRQPQSQRYSGSFPTCICPQSTTAKIKMSCSQNWTRSTRGFAMRLKIIPFLLIAVLTTYGCSTSSKPSPRPTPPPPALEAALAKPCEQITKPTLEDYDVWQGWMQDVVLRAYGDCA